MPEAPRPSTLLERAGRAAAGIGELGSGDSPRGRAVKAVVVVLVVAFVGVFLATQLGKLPDHDWRFEPGWLALAVASAALFYAASGQAWLAILHSLGERLDPAPGHAVFTKALVARYVPTSVLSLVGRLVLAERHGVGKRACFASVVYEVGCSLAAAVVVGSYFVVTLPPLEDVPARFAVFALVPLALGALHPRVFHPLADRGLRKLGREPLPRSLPFSRVLGFVLVYVMLWLLVGVSLFAFAAALHPVGVEDLPYVAASYSVGFCVAVLTFVVPAGLGTRDATIAAALDVVLPGSVAIAIAVAFRIFQTLAELVYLGVATLIGRRGAPPTAGPRSPASSR
ncbi:MAG: lysylphosphatidylglycerol synthase domain-containing protein [Thermoleophilaceae bacterium]